MPAGFSLVAARRRLTAEASLVLGHRPWGTGLVVAAHWPRGPGSVVVAHGFSCSVASVIFPDQGSNPCLLHWQADSLPLSSEGSP